MRVLVILGMHRSGTSMLARALARLGLPLGDDVMTEAADDNALGYWEPRGIVDVQEALLLALGRCTWKAEGALALPAGWVDSEPGRAAYKALRDIAARAVAAAPKGAGFAWGFKDPRTALLLPLWQGIWREIGVTPSYILIVRAPAAVAASLDRRNGIPRPRGELLWLRHNVAALRHAAGALRLVVSYERILAEPVATLAGIAEELGLPASAADIAASAADLVRPDLAHHLGEADDASLGLARRLYDQLRTYAPDLMPDVTGVVDQIEEAFGLLDAGTNATPMLGINGALPFPFVVPDSDAEAVWLSDGPLGVTLRHGNSWTRGRDDTIYLHPNRPQGPVIELAYEGLKLAGRTAFTAEIGLPAGASHAAELTLRIEAANGANVADTTVTLAPDATQAWRVPFTAQAVIGRLRLSARMAEGAANNWNALVRIARPRVE